MCCENANRHKSTTRRLLEVPVIFPGILVLVVWFRAEDMGKMTVDAGKRVVRKVKTSMKRKKDYEGDDATFVGDLEEEKFEIKDHLFDYYPSAERKEILRTVPGLYYTFVKVASHDRYANRENFEYLTMTATLPPSKDLLLANACLHPSQCFDQWMMTANIFFTKDRPCSGIRDGSAYTELGSGRIQSGYLAAFTWMLADDKTRSNNATACNIFL
ncbi:hypothetical protein DFS33DRAFT_1449233 [Desarmillaria ectypa]|nr:hypothetical protein DFS33DRAFT_1449233 [Desarmillaria ectypa]